MDGRDTGQGKYSEECGVDASYHSEPRSGASGAGRRSSKLSLLYLVVAAPRALFTSGFGPFLCQAYFGKRGAILGWALTIYL